MVNDDNNLTQNQDNSKQENQDTNLLLKALMEEIKILKEAKKVADLDPVELERKKESENNLMMRQARNEFALNSLSKNFDSEFEQFIDKSENDLINKSNMNENHRLIRKIKKMFEIQSNYDAIPTSRRSEVDNLLKLNLSEEANFNFKDNFERLDSLLKDFVDSRRKIDLLEAKFKRPASTNLNNEMSVVSKLFWEKALKLNS